MHPDFSAMCGSLSHLIHVEFLIARKDAGLPPSDPVDSASAANVSQSNG